MGARGGVAGKDGGRRCAFPPYAGFHGFVRYKKGVDASFRWHDEIFEGAF